MASKDELLRQHKWGSTCAVIGGMLIHLTLGVNYTWGNFGPYVTSYMRNVGGLEQYHHQDLGYVIGATYVGHALGMVGAGYIEDLFGPRAAVLLGGVIMAGSTVLSSYFLSSYFTFILLYGSMYGLGKGVCYATPLSCAVRWLPHRKALVSGVITAALGASGSTITQLQTILINPSNISPVPIDPSQSTSPRYFTDLDLLHRVSSFVFFLGIGYFVLVCIGALLLREPTPEMIEAVSSQSDDANEKRPLTSKQYDFTAVEAASTPQFYIIFFLFFMGGLCLTFSNATWKFSPAAIVLDDRFLGIVGTLATLCNAAGKVVWGYISDAKSAPFALIIAFIAWGISLILFTFISTTHAFVFAALVSVNFCCGGAMFSLFPSMTALAFGRRYMSSCYGMEFFSQPLAANLSSGLTQNLIGVINYGGLSIAYGAVLLLSSGVCLLFRKRLNTPCKLPKGRDEDELPLLQTI